MVVPKSCRLRLLTEAVGVMIGEMWDLERLCEKAEELGRYTCFVSSVPLKVSSLLLRRLALARTLN